MTEEIKSKSCYCPDLITVCMNCHLLKIKKAKEEVVNKVDTLDDDIITYMNWRDILKQKLKESEK